MDPDLVNTSSEAGMLAQLSEELRSYYRAIREFSKRDISDVLMAIAAFHARAAEIRDSIVVNESRRAAAFRTKQLDPFLEALEFQFKIWSRFQAVRQSELDLTRGGYR